jgi:hypothetical protein
LQWEQLLGDSPVVVASKKATTIPFQSVSEGWCRTAREKLGIDVGLEYMPPFFDDIVPIDVRECSQ